MHTCQFEAISQGNWPSLYTLCKADPLKACPITPLKDPYFMTTHLWGWRSILVKLTFDVGQSQKLGEKILNLDYPFTRRFSKKNYRNIEQNELLYKCSNLIKSPSQHSESNSGHFLALYRLHLHNHLVRYSSTGTTTWWKNDFIRWFQN